MCGTSIQEGNLQLRRAVAASQENVGAMLAEHLAWAYSAGAGDMYAST